jgi:Transposase IS200 like
MAEYRQSAHAVFDLKYHVIWCTKYGKKVLRGRIAERARDLMRQIAQPVAWSLCGVRCHRITSIYCCRHRRFWLRRSWLNISRGDRHVTCRLNFQSCENSIGASTCGPGVTSARRWARWTRPRSKPISRTSGGTRTTSRLRSQRPASLKLALQPGAFRRLEPQCDFQSLEDSTGFQPVVIKCIVKSTGQANLVVETVWRDTRHVLCSR